MELVHELLFTISFSLIVSLLIAKLFSSGSIRVEEKIKKEVKTENFEDRVKGIEEGDIGCLENDLGGGFVVDSAKSACGDGACHVFDESPEKVECKDMSVNLESDKGSLVNIVGLLVEEDCVKSVGLDTESGCRDSACYVFDKSPERSESKDEGVNLVGSDEGGLVNSVGLLVEGDCVKSVGVDTESGSRESPKRSECKDEGSLVNLDGLLVEEECVKCIDDAEVKVEEGDEVFDDDWQGVETTELERRFGAAVAFMDAKVNSSVVNLIDNEVKVELYGLYKVAIEGSCFEPQPMALKMSARANWNSWKRLENLGREDAMEQYIALLSQHVPGWMGSHSSDKQITMT